MSRYGVSDRGIVTPFEDLTPDQVHAFIKKYFRVENDRAAESAIKDEASMGIVKEAYNTARQGYEASTSVNPTTRRRHRRLLARRSAQLALSGDRAGYRQD